jgi:phosphate starvation-inducible PhoH-like protein
MNYIYNNDINDNKKLNKVFNNKLNKKQKKKKNNKNILFSHADYICDNYDDTDYIYENINYKKKCVPLLFSPRNKKQEEYINYINDPNIDIIIANGSAGVGKTALIADIAMNKLLKNEIFKIILIRPSVSVDDNIGFLKGDMLEKMKPWMANIYDIFYKYVSYNTLTYMLENEIIEIAPICFCRGRTFDDSIVILDEAQNTTVNQMFMLLTRIGSNCKIVITGDTSQHDRGYEKSGLSDLLNKLNNNNIDRIKIVNFTENDVERNPIIKKILQIYSN